MDEAKFKIRLEQAEKDIAQLEREVEELKRERREIRSEIGKEVRDAMDGAVRHITNLDKSVREQMAPLAAVGDVLKKVDDQLDANRIEREKRVAVEEALAKQKKAEADDLEIADKKREARNKKLAVYIPVIVAIVGVLGTLIGLAISSHH